MSYRGRGWPGKIVISLNNGQERIIPRITSETSPFRRIRFDSSFHLDFVPRRCLVCCDQAAVLSDISFGDPWLPELKREERTGKSLIISRTRVGEELLQRAAAKGRIELTEIGRIELSHAQNWSCKANSAFRLLTRRLFRKPTPDYGSVSLKPNYRYYLTTLPNYLPSYLSSNRCAWHLIHPYAVIRHYIWGFIIRLISSVFKLLKLIKRRA